MKLLNLVKKEPQRSILTLGMPNIHAAFPFDLRVDLTDMFASGWIDWQTEVHLSKENNACISSADLGTQHVEHLTGVDRFSLIGAQDVVITSELGEDGHSSHRELVTHLNRSMTNEVAWIQDKVVATRGSRQTRMSLVSRGIRKFNTVRFHTRTKDIQSIRVYESEEAYKNPAVAPMISFADIRHGVVAVSVDRTVHSMFVVITRGNTKYTVMKGLKYEGAEERHYRVDHIAE